MIIVIINNLLSAYSAPGTVLCALNCVLSALWGTCYSFLFMYMETKLWENQLGLTQGHKANKSRVQEV
jgi:hypothetical protein